MPNYQLLESNVVIMLCFPFCSTCYTALQIKNSTRNQSSHLEIVKRINLLRSEAAIFLHFRYSTHYTVLQTKNSMTSISVTNPVTMEIMDDAHDSQVHRSHQALLRINTVVETQRS